MSIELNYRIHGVRPPTTVFIHGVGSNATVWNPVIDILSTDNNSMLVYDLRGHGCSPIPQPPYSIDDFISDHISLLHQLDLGPVNLVGFSLGGLIAQGVAIRYPKTVNRLIVIGSVAGRTPQEQMRVKNRLESLREQGPSEVAKVSVERWFTEHFLEKNPEVYHQIVARMAALDQGAYLAAYQVLAETDFINQLHCIKCPTLAITGDGDMGSTPKMAHNIAQSVQDGQVKIIKEAKHSVLIEQPDIIAALIREFIFEGQEK